MYFLVDLSNTADVEPSYDRAAGSLTEAFDRIRTERIPAMASLAIAADAHGIDHDRNWPFVSLSFVQNRASISRRQSGTLQVSIAPYVLHGNVSSEWYKYVVSDEPQVAWIEESIEYQDMVGVSDFIDDYGTNWRNDSFHEMKKWSGEKVNDPPIPLEEEEHAHHAAGFASHLPIWQSSPFLSFDEVNIDLMNEPNWEYAVECTEQGSTVISGMNLAPAGGMQSKYRDTAKFARLMSMEAGQDVEYQGDPMSNFYVPIFNSFDDDRKATAVLVGLFNWGNMFAGVLPLNFGGIDVVLNNPCYDSFTYRLGFGGIVTPIGTGVSPAMIGYILYCTTQLTLFLSLIGFA